MTSVDIPKLGRDTSKKFNMVDDDEDQQREDEVAQKKNKKTEKRHFAVVKSATKSKPAKKETKPKKREAKQENKDASKSIYAKIDDGETQYMFVNKRTLVRQMGPFLSQRFQNYKKNNKISFELKDVEDLAQIKGHLVDFYNSELDGLVGRLVEQKPSVDSMIPFLIAILYNSRSSCDQDGNQVSSDTFIQDTYDELCELGQENAFLQYWNVKHKYNVRNLDAFFDVKEFCLLFNLFVESPEFEPFLGKMKIKDKSKSGDGEDEKAAYRDSKNALLRKAKAELQTTYPLSRFDWKH